MPGTEGGTPGLGHLSHGFGWVTLYVLGSGLVGEDRKGPRGPETQAQNARPPTLPRGRSRRPPSSTKVVRTPADQGPARSRNVLWSQIKWCHATLTASSDFPWHSGQRPAPRGPSGLACPGRSCSHTVATRPASAAVHLPELSPTGTFARAVPFPLGGLLLPSLLLLSLGSQFQGHLLSEDLLATPEQLLERLWLGPRLPPSWQRSQLADIWACYCVLLFIACSPWGHGLASLSMQRAGGGIQG